MAVLAIGLASAAATSAAGYAGYSALAYSVATTIASTYFKKGESTEGPRLSDLNVTISSYGSVIPRMFGTIRSSANMIWSSGIKETKHKKKVGGKGGFGKATQTTYTYSTSIAYLLCDNEIEAVRRIWSNGEVVYDLSETNSGVSSSLSVNSVKVYKGTETQLPDPTIEAVEGVGNVEAYRGCAYIVFDTLQLADFNNALPNFTFEVVGLGGEKTYITQQFGEISEQFNASYYDEENQKLIRIKEGNEYDITYYITDLYSNETIIKNFPVIAGYSSPNVRRVNKVNDNILVSSFANYIVSLDSNLNYIGKVDLNTFFNYSSTLSYVQSIALNDYNLKAYGVGFRNNTLSIAEITTATINAETSNIFYYVDASQYAFQENNLSFSATKQLSNKNNGIIIYDNAIYFNYLKGTNTQIFKIDLNFKTLSLVKEIENFSTLNTYGDVFTIDEVSGKLILSGIDNTLTYTYKGSLLTLDLDGLMMSKISVIDAIFKETGNMPDFSLNNAFSISNNRDVLFHASNISVSIFYTISFNIDNLNSYVVNVNDISANMGSGLFFGNFYSYYNSSQQSFLNANNNIRKIDKIITDRHKKSTVFLDQIINTLCLRSGLQLSEFDTSDLNDIVVNGYSITNSSTLRSVIEQLIAPFNFNVVESDFKLFFKKNQKPITKVIDIKELGAKNYTGLLSFLDDLTTVRTLEQDLSKSVNITYIDIDDDYNQNTQQSSRENVKTNAVNTVEIALVLSANEAKNIAQRLLYDSYVQRDMFSFDLNYNHIDLEAGDVIQVVDDRKKYTMKIRQIQSDGGIIKVEAISYNSYVYDQYAVGSSSASQRNKINVTSRSVPILLDIPLLTNDDFVGVYSGSYPATEDLKWNGSVMYTSNDNAEFSEKNSYFEKVVNGYSINALGNFTEGNIFDSYNYVDVLVNDELENATQNQVLNGANLAILGNEIIQFMNASLIGDKKYRLSGLLRARYATEKYLATHTNSERFIMLDKDTIQAINQSNSLINSNLFYKNVTFGRTLNETASTNFVNTARNQVIPSVRHIQSARNANGDLNVNYIPRLRGIALLLPYAVPDDIDDSNYQIDILKSGSVVRTISTKETFINYTKEMQVADFGAIQSSISMNIYKLNAVIGRGEARSVTL